MRGRALAAVGLLVLAAGCGTQHQPADAPGDAGAVAAGANSPNTPGTTRPAPTGTPVTATPTPPRPADPAALRRAADRLAKVRPDRLPETAAGAQALLAALPATLAGKARTRTGPEEASWADGSTVTAAPLAEAAGPGVPMRKFFDMFTASGQFTVAHRSTPADRLLWFVGTATAAPGGPVAAAADADGQFLYGIEASSPEALTELVEAVAIHR